MMMNIRVESEIRKLEPTKIICLLRSYAAHARELGNRIPDRIRFFLKPPSSLVPSGGSIILPQGVKRLHHEVELAIVISKRGKDIPENEAMDHIGLFLPMLDITARDLQDEAKSRGFPWTEAKGFDTFAPYGPEAVPADLFDWKGRRIWLKVNGEVRQDSSTDLLLFSPERVIAEVSRVMTLEPDDIIMTGTPAGVGPLVPGDDVMAGMDGMEPMHLHVVRG